MRKSNISSSFLVYTAKIYNGIWTTVKNLNHCTSPVVLVYLEQPLNAKIEVELGHTEKLYVFWAGDIFAVYSTIRSTIVTGSKFISLGYIICFETGFTPVTM